MAADPQTRLHRLAARVRWWDRLRRPVAILIAAFVAPLAFYHLRETIGARPIVPSIVPCLMLGAVIWWLVEAGFALLIALWETEHDRLSRSAGLPVARLVRRR